MKWAGPVESKVDEKLAKRSNARQWRGKGGEEDRGCDGRTALREIWTEWEKNGEQQQRTGVVGYC